MADVKNINTGTAAASSQLRERPSAKPLHLHNSDDAKQRVLELNEQEEKDNKNEEQRKTFGRTSDGTGKL
jgi:phosphatidylethanolamine N-methyltransferase